MSEEDKDQKPELQIQKDLLFVGELISLAEAAQASGFSMNYLRDIAVSGRLKATKIGRNWVTTLEAVNEYKNSRSHKLKKEI